MSNRPSILWAFWLFVAIAGALPVAMGRLGHTDAAAADKAPKVANPHGDYQEDCSLCHRADGWKPARISPKFDHEKFGVALAGAHASVKCTQCHTSLDFAMAPTACVDCHADVHNGELGTDCARCHGTRSFIDRHDQVRLHRMTRFPLAGAHITLDCEMCHRLSSPDALTWVNTPTDCQSCHMNDYNATTNPNHASAGFSQDCASCHNEQTWQRVGFDHSATDFPLTGAHVAVACERCHVGGVFGGTPTACISCHQNDYDATNDPAHGAAGFSTDCIQCHTTSGWTGANFNHANTNFPLTGAHVSVPCANCHVGGVYTGIPTNCVSCHQNDYDTTTNPAHAAANFTTDCVQCHTTTRWSGATFDHTPWFPIYSGTHAGRWTNCNECHANAASYADFTCLSCHPHSDQQQTDSSHRGENGYSYTSQACYTCHPQGRK
jgi:hypothetical protein